jgi:predicted PurR-regulated permease PerM
MTTGEVWRGIAIALFCALVVGSVDNALRPRLVGQDTKMHELLIFFSTLGGLMFFGAMGFILGPILAALFVRRGKCSARRSAARLPNRDPRQPSPTIVRQPDALLVQWPARAAWFV